MGTDKAFVRLDGRSLLERTLEVTRRITSDVCIVGDAKKFANHAVVVEDVFPGCGPLGGIHAALRVSRAELNLMLAVDVPFVSSALLRYLIKRAQNSPEAMAVVPRVDGRWQPLCGVYRGAFADAAERALCAGQYTIGELFAVVKMQTVEEDELAQAGFVVEMFRNLNTREDLQAASARKE